MKLRYVFIANTVVAFLFALGLLLVPSTMLGFYGLPSSTSKVDMLLGQYLGTQFFLGGLLSLFLMGLNPSKLLQNVIATFFIANGIGFIVALGAALSKTTTGNFSWLPVVVHLLLAAGFGYFFFMPGKAGDAAR